MLPVFYTFCEVPFRMKYALLLLSVLFFTLTAAAQTPDQRLLEAAVRSMADAQIAFDAARLDAIFTKDYIEISPVGEFDTRDKVLGFYKSELKPPADKMSTAIAIDEFSTRVYGKTAVVIARLTYNITANGKQMPPRSMRVMVVGRKEGSVWKIASAQYTGIRPPQTAPAK